MKTTQQSPLVIANEAQNKKTKKKLEKDTATISRFSQEVCMLRCELLISSGVGKAGVDTLPRKMDTFFLRSLTLSLSIYRNFQSNGANWRSIKHRKKFFYIIGNYTNIFVQHLLLRQLAPFDWKFL